MAEDNHILEVEDLCLRYDGAPVLDHVSLRLRPGQLASLIGPNGAGKSTLLKALVGLLPHDSGRIVCRAREVGYVPQQIEVDRQMPLTVAEFLSLKASRSPFWFGGCGAAVQQRIRAGLEDIGAGHLLRRQLGRLSGGEFQRVLIAYAMLNRPDLLLLDEPLTGVDVRGGMSFHALLHHLRDDLKITVLMVSHDLHLVEHMSDEVFCLNRVMCCHGDPDAILTPENLAHAYGHFPVHGHPATPVPREP